MKKRIISDKRKNLGNKIKSIFLFVLAFLVAGTLMLYAFDSGKLSYSTVLISIAAILLLFFGLFALRRYKDAAEGLLLNAVIPLVCSPVFYTPVLFGS